MEILSFKPKLTVTPITLIQKIVEWIGSILSMIYFSTPLIQIIKMYKGKLKTEYLPITLLLTILFNCTFWLLHGVTESMNEGKFWASLIICNGYGLIINIALLFFFLYIYLAKNINKFIGYGLFVVNLIFEITYLMEIWVIRKNKENNDFVGFIATVVNVCMYLSPATNIIKVCQTGNYEFLPIITNIVGFFTTLIWLIYGALTQNDKDPSAKFTLYSNGFSVLIVAFQISFWLFYFAKYSNNVIQAHEDTSNDNINENNDYQGMNNGNQQ